jgi:hypothetical protein
MKFQLNAADAVQLIQLGITTVAAIREARAKRKAELEVIDASGQPMTDAQFDAHFAAFDVAADQAGAHAAARIEGRSGE